MLANAPVDGLLLFLYLAAPLLAVAAAFIIRWRYRIAVGRLMRTGESANRPAAAAAGKPSAAGAGRLAIKTMAPSGPTAVSRPVVLLAVNYFIAGLIHALTSVAIYFPLNGIEFLPVRTTMVWLVFATPAVLSGLIALGVRLPPIIAAILAWLAVPIAIAAYYGGGFGAVWQLSWLIALPMIASLLVLNRLVGTIAPFLLIPAVFVLLGLLMSLDAALLALQAGGSTITAYASGGLTVLAGLAAGLGYLALIARQFVRGKASELTLQSDMLWLLVSLFHAMPLIKPHGWLALTLFLPFFAYRITLWLLGLVFRSRQPPARLLFLRVFGFAKRQAELHRVFLGAWRNRGPVALIGSPDIALETLDPPELFAFITGRLKGIFVSDPAAVKAGLSEQPGQTVDGLYPVQDFYCFDDTWRAAVQALIDASAAVLMDLRGFGPGNAGCLFEIEQLLMRADPHRLNFLIDDTTDRPFLEKCMQEAWAHGAGRRGDPAGHAPTTVRLSAVQNAKALRALFRLIRPGEAEDR